MIEATITQALRMWRTWNGDHSPIRETGSRELDLRLADAFRMLLFRKTTDGQLDWLEREIMKRPKRRAIDDLYTAELVEWWLDLFEAGKRPTLPHHNDERKPLCVSSRSTRSTELSASI